MNYGIAGCRARLRRERATKRDINKSNSFVSLHEKVYAPIMSDAGCRSVKSNIEAREDQRRQRGLQKK